MERTARYLYALVCVIALLALMASCSLCPGVESVGWPDYRQSDKREHALLGIATGEIGYALGAKLRPDWPEWKKIAAGFALGALAGLAKEIPDACDPKHHDCDPKDFIATTLGGAIGSVSLSLVFRF